MRVSAEPSALMTETKARLRCCPSKHVASNATQDSVRNPELPIHQPIHQPRSANNVPSLQAQDKNKFFVGLKGRKGA